jgi:hypothetical protein
MGADTNADMAHYTVWTYPWDVARLGVDAVLAEIADHGLHGIDLAATYHPISALSPRGDTVGAFFCPRGAVFFPARAARYGRVKPHVWPDRDVVTAWTDVAEHLDAHGLELNAWTIGLFQPWIAQDYPETARVYSDGTRLDAGICVSSPAVHEYLTALVTDLADQFPVTLVKLEGMFPPLFDYGWTRRRIYFSLTPRQQQLMGLCFCASCTSAGAAQGLDVDAIRARVRASLHIGTDDSSTVASPDNANTDGDAELDAYAALAPAAASRLIADLAAALRAAGSSTRLGVSLPFEGDIDQSVEGVLDHVATVLLANLAAGSTELRRAVDTVRAHEPAPSLECFVHPPFTSTGSGGIPHGIQEDLADPAWRANLRAARDLGVQRFSLYNYGLLTADTFRALVAVARNP